MVDMKAIITDVRDTLVAELADHLSALYLFGPAALEEYVFGRSDVDLLLIVKPEMPLVAARNAFRPSWQRHADALGRGPLVATHEDFELHLKLFPSLHRSLRVDGICLHGKTQLDQLPSPPPVDQVEEAADAAARAITGATALTTASLPPGAARRLTRRFDRLARRITGMEPERTLNPVEAAVAIHARLRELAKELPGFDWQGTPPVGDVPDLLPGCLAFYQREKHLIAVLERVDEETLANVDWVEVGAAAKDAHAQFGLATPWQLRLAARQTWVDSLYFRGFEQLWGADILGDLEADELPLLRQLARVASEQRVEAVPATYLTIEQNAISRLIHDTQNVLLNAGLRAELFARFTGREFDLPDWPPPGRDVPQPERVAAAWERWRELTAYYVSLWQQVAS